jgi:spore coat protein U-like protein
MQSSLSLPSIGPRGGLLRIAIVTLFVAVIPASALAQGTLGGTLGASLELTSSCVISGDTATTGANFGTLDFGTRPATFSGVLTTQATGGAGGPGNTQLLCSPDVTSVTVTVSGGSNPGEGASLGTGARALAQASNFMPYDVYSDSGHTTVYPTNGTGVAVSVPAPGTAFALPIYGRINKTSAAAVAIGTYVDTLTVTIEF